MFFYNLCFGLFGKVVLSFFLSLLLSIITLPSFEQVTPWLYRGSQPSLIDFLELRLLGIKTIVNFRDEPPEVVWESHIVTQLGMQYITLPWRLGDTRRKTTLAGLEEVTDNIKNYPIFIHCKYGQDRTGVMTVLLLMHYKSLSLTQAKKQAFRKTKPFPESFPTVNEDIHFLAKEGK